MGERIFSVMLPTVAHLIVYASCDRYMCDLRYPVKQTTLQPLSLHNNQYPYIYTFLKYKLFFKNNTQRTRQVHTTTRKLLTCPCNIKLAQC